jgi:hypothetical protein
MSRRASELLEEMQGIFGDSFGDAYGGSLTESEEISEAPRPMPARHPSPKGLLSKGKDLPTRHGKSGMTLKAKKAMKASSAHAKKKDAEGSERFHAAMKDIRGEMDKSHKKSLEKKAAPASDSPGGEGKSQERKGSQASAASKSGRRHFPFKRNANLGPGPRGDHHDETKCWKCKCGNIYSDGCNCIASGNGENCPDKGTHKKISYNKGYKRDYNNEYHAWRAKQGGAVTRRLGSTRAS